MRTDALGGILRHAAADLLFVSSLNTTHSFLDDPGAGSQALERELAAFVELHPEYEDLSVTLDDSSRSIHTSGSNGLDASHEDTPSAAFLATSSRWPDGGIFVLDATAESAGVGPATSGDLSGLPLLVGTHVRSDDGNHGATVTLRPAWGFILDQYEHGHPDSASQALLLTGKHGWLFVPTQSGSHTADESEVPASDLAASALPIDLSDITSSEEAQLKAGGGLLTYSTFRPAAEAQSGKGPTPPVHEVPSAAGFSEVAWKAISWVSPNALKGIRGAGLLTLLGWNAFAIASLGVISWFGADRLTRRSALHRRTVAEKALLSSALGRYMPKVSEQNLLADPRRYAHLGGSSCLAAILFADIRGFTNFAEGHDPEHVVATLNMVLASLTPPLRQHAGVLDKYLGDGFLAFFVSSSDGADAARHAVNAAHEMQDAFASLSRSQYGADLQSMALGIGISCGRVVLGNVGSEDLMDFTVIGDAVNVAARLQAAAARGEILITSDVRDLADLPVGAGRSITIELRGRRTPVEVHAITDPIWVHATHGQECQSGPRAGGVSGSDEDR